MRRRFKKSTSVLIALLMIITMMIAGVGCGSESANEVINDGATLAAEATTAEETTAATEETSETTTETTEETSTEETTKATTKATKATTKATTKETQEVQTTAAAKVCYVSVDGYCSKKSIEVADGDTAYSVLKKTGANVSAENSQYGIYVKGINGKFEFDEGATSGWMYSVNGKSPNVGAGKYSVGSGDVVKWYYVKSY